MDVLSKVRERERELIYLVDCLNKLYVCCQSVVGHQEDDEMTAEDNSTKAYVVTAYLNNASCDITHRSHDYHTHPALLGREGQIDGEASSTS